MLEDRVGEYLDAVAAPLTLEELEVRRIGDETGEPRPFDDDGVVTVPDWDLAIPESNGFGKPKVALLAAAAVVLIALVVGLVALANPELVEVATELPVDEVGSDEPLLETPEAPIRAFERPVVLIDTESRDGLNCLGFRVGEQVRSFFGTSAVVEIQFFPEVPPFGSSVFLDLGGAGLGCDEGGGDVSRGASSIELYGPPSDLPALAELSTGGFGHADERDAWFTVMGIADDTVQQVELVDRQTSEQVFRVSGDRFRVDAMVEEGTLGGDVIIEVLFTDGTRELRDVSGSESEDSCEERALCLEAWYQLYLDEAIEGEATEQAAALQDFELTQDEYDAAADAFLDCLPSNVGASVVAGSNDAATVAACYQQHLEFIDKGRVVLNLTWLGDPDNLDQYLEDDRFNTPTGLRPATRSDESASVAEEDAGSEGGLQSPLETFFDLVVDPTLLSEAMNDSVVGYRNDFNECIVLAGWSEWQETLVEPETQPSQFIGVQNVGDYLEGFGYGVALSADARVIYGEWELSYNESGAENARTAGQERVLDSLSATESEALNQALTDCDDKSRTDNPFPNTRLAQQREIWGLIQESHGGAEEDSTVIAAEELWLGCMRESGFPHSSRTEAIRHLSSLLPDIDSDEGPSVGRLDEFRDAIEHVRVQEAELVAIDLECSASTRVDELTREARFEIEDEIIATQRERLNELLATR